MMLAAENLTKQFGNLVAVNKLDLRVEYKTVTGVIGPNGSGKTTLLNLLSGLFAPTEGRLFLDSKEITLLPPQARVIMGIGRTFQLVSVFTSLKVWENMVLATCRFKQQKGFINNFFFSRVNREEMWKDCMEALETVGLREKAHRNCAELSYGDKRLLEIAIALSLKPKVLFLDEPLAGLSDVEIAFIMELLNRLKGNLSIVIVEHKISKVIDFLDYMYVMNQGLIIAQGEPQEVLSDPIVRDTYWGKGSSSC